MAGWVALSDRPLPLDGLPAGRMLHCGRLIVEVTTPVAGPAVLLDDTGPNHALSMYLSRDGAVTVWRREGASSTRLTLPGPLPSGPGVIRLTMEWAGSNWALQRDALGHARARIHGTGALPLSLPYFLTLCEGRGNTSRHGAVLWFGLTDGPPPPERAPWIGPNTPIATPTGFRPAARLFPGEMVMTDAGPRMLRSVRQLDLPARGHYAPILLRAPFFRNARDLLVSADQLVMLHGPEIEYQLGEDAVLAEARHLACGTAALQDGRRAVIRAIVLDLGEARLISSDGCAFGLLGPEGPPALRKLHGYEAAALFSSTGGGQRHRAA